MLHSIIPLYYWKITNAFLAMKTQQKNCILLKRNIIVNKNAS